MFAFKEWTHICDTLGSGTQSIIIRKGGIAEGRDGFRFKHSEFLLFPTLFHEQVSKLRLPASASLPEARADGSHEIELLARVEWTREVDDWAKVQSLKPLHLWADAEIEKRFRQDDQPGVSVAFVRVYRLGQPHVLPDSPKYGGCRSWIEVPDLAEGSALSAVLDDEAHAERETSLKALI